MKNHYFTYKYPKLKLNSLFLIKKPEIETEIQTEQHDPIVESVAQTESRPTSRRTIIKSNRKLTLRKNNTLSMKRKNTRNANSTDPDALFSYFLHIHSKIEEFEIKNDNNSKNFLINSKEFNKCKDKININSIFYNIYLKYSSEDKKEWNNFTFIKPLYKYLYPKSKILQKQIVKFCIINNLKYNDVLNSYDKQYTCNLAKHNWFLYPRQAYDNYYKLYLKESNHKDEEKIKTEYNYLGDIVGDVVVKLNNNGLGKTLIYNGKLFNVYIDDIHSKKNNGIKMVSMNVQDSESNKTRKEVVYTENDLINELNKPKYSKSVNKISLRQKNHFNTMYPSPQKNVNYNILHSDFKNRTTREIKNKDKMNQFFSNYKLSICKNSKLKIYEYTQKNKKSHSNNKNKNKVNNEFPFLFKNKPLFSTHNRFNKSNKELMIDNYISNKNGETLNEDDELTNSHDYRIFTRNNGIKNFFVSRSKDLYY